jgi:hypothetical protein
MKTPLALVENLEYTFTVKSSRKDSLTLSWENHSASVPIIVH